jgi:acyl-CoA dehydrogenase
VKDGDDYVINGHKWFTSSAEGASFAIVMAITNPEASNRYKRASQIIVPIPTPGFQLVRNISVMGDEGSDYASHAEVRYENCRVPQSNLLGKGRRGLYDRAGATWTRKNSSLHALDRNLRARV